MKKSTIFLGVLFVIFSACCQNKSATQLIILPLHPYVASPIDYDSTQKKDRSFIVKYYFIKGVYEATDELSSKIDSFIIQSLKADNDDYMAYGGYSMYFFKESSQINSNYRYTGTDDNPENHTEDLLFIYSWSAKKFTGCNYYKNGKPVKTIYRKSGDLFK